MVVCYEKDRNTSEMWKKDIRCTYMKTLEYGTYVNGFFCYTTGNFCLENADSRACIINNNEIKCV